VPTGQLSDAPPANGVRAFAANPFILDDTLGRKIDDGEIGVVATAMRPLPAMPKIRCGPALVRSTKRARLKRRH
jgi:hypothetical protein